ncbi:hypothetical protein [Nonomuraea endophytica]|uniref:hypothetical protein n=1 Tax=Nonomuraea endophytica TaxID=714136 RepID=UPI0037CAC008
MAVTAAMIATTVAATRPAAVAAPTPDAGKAFTECMRSHGLPGFPEVVVSEDGLVNLTLKGENVDVMSKKYGTAVAACQHLLPTNTNLPKPPTAPTAPTPPAAPSLPS